VPVIVQHAVTAAVLMLGYMNREALAQRWRTAAWFLQPLEAPAVGKGEISGNHLQLVEIRADCDADALLLAAQPAGPVCHTGSASCLAMSRSPPFGVELLLELDQLIGQRIEQPSEGSYTANLYARGVRRVAQKVGEEGLEVALAGAASPIRR